MLSALIFIAGLAIGVSVFLYLLSAVSGGMKLQKKLTGSGTEKTKPQMETGTVTFRGRRGIPPGSRICPLCGSELTKYEGLYASKILDGAEPKLMIMGCKYCFKEK